MKDVNQIFTNLEPGQITKICSNIVGAISLNHCYIYFASWELMGRVSRFKAEKEKNPANCYNAKLAFMEHLELETTDGASITVYAGSATSAPGKDLQDGGWRHWQSGTVREKEKKSRMVHDEVMAHYGRYNLHGKVAVQTSAQGFKKPVAQL